jgi:Ca2+-binding RTX toxin-like protein
VTASLTTGTATGDGSDSLFALEIVDGSSFADNLTGGPGNDSLVGEAGDDVLDGLAGIDYLKGGDGTDTCLNGEILDTCEATSLAPSGAGGDRAAAAPAAGARLGNLRRFDTIAARLLGASSAAAGDAVAKDLTAGWER